MLMIIKDPYGVCARVADPVPFPECDCVDEDGDPIEVPHSPECIKNAAVVKKLIYSDEEAERRAKEEKEIDRRGEEYFQKSLEWLQTTKEGKKRWEKEMKRSLRDSKRGVKTTTDALKDANKALREAHEEVKSLHERQKAFENGKPKALHQFNTSEEAAEAVLEGEEALEASKEEVKNMERKLEEAKKFKSFTIKQHEQRLRDIVKDKELIRAIAEITQEGRLYARRKKKRRPWDGKLGRDYKKWMKKMEEEELNPSKKEVEEKVEEEEIDDKKEKPVIAKGYVPPSSSEDEEEEEDKGKIFKFAFHTEESDEEIETNFEQIQKAIYMYTG
jgi:hypothetical protein